MRKRKNQPETGSNRDTDDQARLRHGRDRNLGFAVGQYLQPAPMLFTRDGHNAFLGDMFRGRPAFLIGAGPSLVSHDLSLLQQRGILTLALNNAAAIVRPQLWTSVDDPGNFSDAIWRDPGIFKFVPLCHMEKTFRVRAANGELVESTESVGDMPAVFGYRRNERFVPEQWLYEDSFNWGNHTNLVDASGNKGSRSIFYVALRLLFYLGARSVYLLGCDFRMETGKQNYAFEQDRTHSSVRNNNSTFRILNDRLEQLKPHFEQAGLQVFNCTPDSGLKVFPATRYEDAITEACRPIPPIDTKGMYDFNQRMKDAQKPPAPVAQLPGVAATNGTKPRVATKATNVVEQLTLATYVGLEDVAKLRMSWPLWQKYLPEMSKRPIVVMHDESWSPAEFLQRIFEDQKLVRTVGLSSRTNLGGTQPTHAILRLIGEQITTPWCLYFESGAYCKQSFTAADLERMLANANNRMPVLAVDPNETKLPENGAPSWWFCLSTTWARRALALRSDGQTSSAWLTWCAAQTGEPIAHIDLHAHGWERSANIGKLQKRCRELLVGGDQK